MLHITGDDIAALNDEDLRTLVGLLCEAELRRRNLPSSAVTWGGNQTAKDAGLDVRVALARGTTIDGFIPKTDTGFQVKRQNMPRKEIIGEMKPNGVLRPAILDLIKTSGAYVIVSSAGSTSGPALESRRAAMAEALRDSPNAANLTLEFYDRGRIATWVRDHAGLIPWVRSRIGKAITGWQSYGSWSHTPEGTDPTYLVDDTARIKTGEADEGDGLSAVDGINKIRDVLRTPGHIVRLVGLSGVGKTRLIEALFDPTVGVNSLDSSIAIYTDVATGPDPQPVGLASDLVASRTCAILAIDNCPPDVHRQLSEIVRSAGTTISIVTVEYDIREDQPEGTDVFSLDTSSTELIEKLVSRRFPWLSQVDSRTVAEFSGGNARIALSLAGTVKKSESIAGLSDAELFRRLFQQRHEPDTSLMAISEACSLVYSFEGEKLSGDGAELPILGALVGKSPEEVFSGLAELKRRDLLQRRGPWRAVLPHAVANRLATRALESIPRARVLSAFVESAPTRLLQSFSRRLGYLDGSKEAELIVQSWLAPGGFLANLANLNELGRAIFGNVAPVAPDAALRALETVFAEGDEATLRTCTHFGPLLRSLAYDAAHFERAVSLLVKLARLPQEERSSTGPVDVVASLFYIVLSGTHAPLNLRLEVLDELLRSNESSTRDCGVKALQAMLKTGYFSSPYSFEFGARSRDYGYHPKTHHEVSNWFAAVLKLAEPFALSDSPVAGPVRSAIANEFRGLWNSETDHLERVCRAIADKRFWREGWIAARQTRNYDGAGLPPDIATRLTTLEEFLRPKDLVDKIRGVVLGSRAGRFDIDDLEDLRDKDYAGAMMRAAAVAEQLGRDLITDEKAFATLLPELIGGGGRVTDLGRGVALATEEPRQIWVRMVSQLASTETNRVDLLGGFLEGLQKRDVALADALLDEALDDPLLARWVPVLQRSTAIDEKALARLHRILENNTTPITQFLGLAYGRISDVIPAPAFKALVLAIASKPEGIPVAMEILSMRLHSDGTDKRPSAPEVLEAGKALLGVYQFHRRDGQVTREDYELGAIIGASLADEEGKPIVRRLCRDLMDAVARYEVYSHDYGDLVAGLFNVHPIAVLDELFSGDQKSQSNSVRLLMDLLQFRQSPMDSVEDDIVLSWCDLDPNTRYPLMAAAATLFNRPDDKTPHEWTPLARKLLVKAPDPVAVFKEIASRLRPMSWSGSRATKLESRLQLLERLDIDGLPALGDVLPVAMAALKREVDEERRRETDQDRVGSGRFE